MARACWNGAVIAESDRCVVVEQNHYFPPEGVRWERLVQSTTLTECEWKGVASYYHVVVGDMVDRDAAWCYPAPMEAAESIRGHVAFWNGVVVEP